MESLEENVDDNTFREKKNENVKCDTESMSDFENGN